MGIAKVSLGASLISPLACAQIGAQLQVPLLGGPIATQCLEHFPDFTQVASSNMKKGG